MTHRSHDEWMDRLSEYVDDGLDAGDRSGLEAHLFTCASCRSVLAELREVVEAAHDLGDVQPERDLWPGIADAIGASRNVIPLAEGRLHPRRRGLFMSVPQLAAASVALMVVSAAGTFALGGRSSSASPPGSADGLATRFAGVGAGDPPPALAEELGALERTLHESRDLLDAGTIQVLERNLAVIERAIDESRRALAGDPANAFLRDHLERAYRDKLELLRDVTTLTEWAT